MSKRAVVHRVPDLDAVACLEAAGVKAHNVLFLSTSASEVPKGWEDARVLDHPMARRWFSGEQVRSALETLPQDETEGFDPKVFDEVRESVGTYRHPKAHFTLADVLSAMRTALVEDGIGGRALDQAVCKSMGQIIRGLNSNYRAEKETIVALQNVEVEGFADFYVAVLPPSGRFYKAGAYLAGRGIAASIYASPSSLGITRHTGFSKPDLRMLSDHLPGWYVHPGGMVVCWGSSKAPVDGPPPAGTPQNQQELLALMKRVYR